MAATYIGKPCLKCLACERYVSNNRCAPCQRKFSRKWYANNPEKARERSIKWNANNPEKYRERGRKWKADNPEKVREHSRKWYASNSEKIRESNRKIAVSEYPSHLQHIRGILYDVTSQLRKHRKAKGNGN